MITEDVSTLKIHRLTQAQYERERDAGNLEENAIYLTPGGSSDGEYVHAVDELPDPNDEDSPDIVYLADDETDLPVDILPPKSSIMTVDELPDPSNEDIPDVIYLKNDNKDNAVPATEKRYVLIKETTTTEEVGVITIEGFSELDVYYTADIPATGDSNSNGTLHAADKVRIYASAITKPSTSRGLIVHHFIENGVLKTDTLQIHDGGLQASTLDWKDMKLYSWSNYITAVDIINNIELRMLDSKKFPVGTNLKVYALREVAV